jgi:hypothetical protein
VEEVFRAVLCGDEPETFRADQPLDGTVHSCHLSSHRIQLAELHGMRRHGAGLGFDEGWARP